MVNWLVDIAFTARVFPCGCACQAPTELGAKIRELNETQTFRSKKSYDLSLEQ